MNKKWKYGIPLFGGFIGLVSGLSLIAASNHLIPSIDKVAGVQEKALILSYDGSSQLEELLRSQKLKLEYDGLRLVAAVDAREAVASACASSQHAQNPVCGRYADIQMLVEAKHAAQQARYGWMMSTGLGFGLAGASGALYYVTSIFKATRREATRQNSSA